MRLALMQTNQDVGDIEGNTRKIISLADKAKADLVVFPELSVTGYCPLDLLLKKNFVEENLAALQKIAGSTKKSVIVGFVDKKESRVYNSAAFISGGEVKQVYHKKKLPNYAIFDEKRWFTPGENNGIVSFRGRKIGVSICEDAWDNDVFQEQSMDGAEFFINISASPYSSIKLEEIRSILLKRHGENKKPLLYVNQVGGEDGIIYYGQSCFIDKGKVVKKAKTMEEDTLIVNI